MKSILNDHKFISMGSKIDWSAKFKRNKLNERERNWWILLISKFESMDYQLYPSDYYYYHYCYSQEFWNFSLKNVSNQINTSSLNNHLSVSISSRWKEWGSRNEIATNIEHLFASIIISKLLILETIERERAENNLFYNFHLNPNLNPKSRQKLIQLKIIIKQN